MCARAQDSGDVVSLIWPTWPKTEGGLPTQRKTKMLLLEEKEMSAWKTTDRHYPALGPNAKGPTLYNMFLELKRRGSHSFPPAEGLPPSNEDSVR